MALILIVRSLLSWLSLALLGFTLWLAWTWYRGDSFVDIHGVVHIVRHDWRLWTAIGLFLWSFGGGSLILKPFLAKRNRRPLDTRRHDGQLIDGTHGNSLYVESIGRSDAPCLVLTHGWGMDSTIWGYQKEDLSRDFRVVTWDLAGMGKSKAGPGGVDLKVFAADLARVIAWTGADSVVLAGHSIGGMTTQTLVRDHANLVERHVAGIILINTTYKNPLTTMILAKLATALQKPLVEPMFHVTNWLSAMAWLSGWQAYLSGTAHIANRIAFASQVTHEQLEHTTLLSTRNPPGAQARGNLSMFHWEATGALAKVKTPVLVLGGKNDILTKSQASITMAESRPDIDLMVFDDANHMGFLERADLYNQAIASFARDVMATPSVQPGAIRDSASTVS